MKLLRKILIPNYENALRIEYNTRRFDFEIEDDEKKGKCCTIL